jgi:hypothetical protein
VNDLIFVTHAVVVTCVIIYQCKIYKLDAHHLNRWHLYLVVLFWILLGYNFLLCIAGILPFVNKTTDYKYTVIEYLGYVKVIISFVKYTPQAYMNWSRKSTIGWSIGNVLLDLTGGLLAFGQQAIDAYRKDDTGEFTSNIAKLLLSCESVAFDLLFIVQHYVLYRGNNHASSSLGLSKEEQEALEQETQARARAHVESFVPKAIVAVVTGEKLAYTPVDPSGESSLVSDRSLNQNDDSISLDVQSNPHSHSHQQRLLNGRKDSRSDF